MSDSPESPSKQLVMQRVHNRILEVLEQTSCFDAQREYQRTYDFINVPTELICEWADWEWAQSDPGFDRPAFSPAERDAVIEFHRVWSEVADTLPDPIPDLEGAILLPEWTRLRNAAVRALAVFRIRGRLPEDDEIASD